MYKYSDKLFFFLFKKWKLSTKQRFLNPFHLYEER
jgi:hypothetical protein